MPGKSMNRMVPSRYGDGLKSRIKRGWTAKAMNRGGFFGYDECAFDVLRPGVGVAFFSGADCLTSSMDTSIRRR
ncbi:MAG: hypothetical protein A4E45_02006 [Methanosaeta sp. PtaB.Bin039]|nr:MAG: hypothetical protein A4E45_02006 [Methanosaeta sp. PtaB.Bin039]OPY44301.1 MAG: hypothetical protein A4E47_01623 [Methanosaeta sp. PtaU1.Bin028]